MHQAIKNIKELLLAYYPEAEVSGFTRIIMESVTGYSYANILLDDKKLTRDQQNEIHAILERLVKYEPIQYILGETEFFGLPFCVNQHTLIPRPETEELVELIVNENKDEHLSVLDVGTGSGCIAVALAKYMKNAEVSAWDFSQEALDIASLNSKRNSVHVSFQKVDVLSDYPNDEKFDIIVSNPPYVLESEKLTMNRNVLDYEPHSALFVPDSQALLFYERIADIALNILKPQGRLYFEINQMKGTETMKMLQNKGLSNVQLYQDISKNDRIIRAELKN